MDLEELKNTLALAETLPAEEAIKLRDLAMLRLRQALKPVSE